MTALPMPSSFRVPVLKKQLSARIPTSIHAKLEHVRELWVELARLQGEESKAVEAIDLTHVVETLLGRAVDEELAQYGGFPTSDEAKAAQMKALAQAVKSARK